MVFEHCCARSALHADLAKNRSAPLGFPLTPLGELISFSPTSQAHGQVEFVKMNRPNAADYNLVFSDEHLKPALLISLLSVWVLVGVFHYLNTYTRRRYFTIWTTAWLFYALWLTLFFLEQATWGGTTWQMWLGKEWCLRAYLR